MQLLLCVEQTPCVARGGSVRACVRDRGDEGADDVCRALRRAYFECRRGQLDMRSRIRGRKHLDTGEQPPS